MPRSRKVEKPHQHPFDYSREQVALARFNAHVARRNQAIDAARAVGIVRVPPTWSSWELVLPQSNAFIETRWSKLARPQLPSTPLADALAANTSVRRERPGEPIGEFVEPRERWLEHEHAMQRRTNGTLEPHTSAILDTLGTNMPLAVVEATTGSTRAQVRSSHVARVVDLHAATFASVDQARTWAERRLSNGDTTAPLAIVRTNAGVRVASVASNSLGLGLDAEPLVGALAASGTRLNWHPSTAALVAVLGLDGIRWM